MSFLIPTIPIVPKSAVTGGSATGGSFSIPFQVQHQAQSEWCWAAVSASVAAYFGSTTWTQCVVASTELNLSCCHDPIPSGCNRGWSLDTALRSVGHLVAMLNGAVSFPNVQQSLKKAAPIGVRIVWAGSTQAHFIAIAGWLVDPSGTEFVDISDPWYGDAQFKYSDVVGAYRSPGDVWSHTYLTGRIGALPGGATAGQASPTS